MLSYSPETLLQTLTQNPNLIKNTKIEEKMELKELMLLGDFNQLLRGYL
jgi:hypothetical protein